jgi:hypothetical protein
VKAPSRSRTIRAAVVALACVALLFLIQRGALPEDPAQTTAIYIVLIGSLLRIVQGRVQAAGPIDMGPLNRVFHSQCPQDEP